MGGERDPTRQTPQPSESARAPTGRLQWLRGRGVRDGLMAMSILGLAALLRFWDLGTQPVWLDEAYSWWDAHQSIRDLWTLVPQCDPHPPLYFLLLKGWILLFGDGTLALRAPSALMGIATTGLVILAGREIDRRVGWLAGLLFALTPFQVEFGHEARPYTLLCLGAALIAFGALRIARMARMAGHARLGEAIVPAAGLAFGFKGAARRAWESVGRYAMLGWLSLFLGGVVVLWTNDTSVLIMASLCAAFAVLMLIDRGSRRLLKPLAIVLGVVGVLWLPYLPVLLQQARGVESDFWIPRPESWRFANELRMVVSLSSFEAVWWAVAVMAAGLFLMWRRGAWRQAILLAFLVVAPVAMNYGVSMTVKPIFIARALIGIAPAVAVIVAAAVMLMRTTWLRQVALTVLVTAHVAALGLWYANYQGKEPWDNIASEVAGTHELHLAGNRDTIVLLAANELALPLEHAFEDIHASVALQGAPANFPSPGLAARYPSGKCAPSVQGQNLASIARAISGHHTVYFITRTNNVYDPGNGIAHFLQSLGLRQTEVTAYMPGFLEVHKFVAAQRKAPALAHSGALPELNVAN